MLLAELKRRNVFRAAAAYLALGWVVIEVAETTVPLLQLPSWLPTAALWVGIAAFPFVLAFSWVYELTPEGIKRESQVAAEQSITPETGRKLDLITIAMVTLAIAVVAGRYLLEQKEVILPPGGAGPQSIRQVASGDTPVVAVLPFQSSGSDDGGFLAAGLHDDLLTRLARLQAFRVISRTSVMGYANNAVNIRQIGEELGADYILEGGVQAIGKRVRINTQLIDATADEHLWAETYDRELDAENLFDIQANLARAIADKMHSALTPQDRAVMAEVSTRNMEAYNAYLRALKLWDEGSYTEANCRAVIQVLESAVERDPEFAQAWAQLSTARSRLIQLNGDRGLIPEVLAARDRAQSLRPGLPEADIATAIYLYRVEREYQAALDVLESLEARHSLDASTYMKKAWLLNRLGRFDEAYRNVQAAHRLDPRSLSVAEGLIQEAVETGRCEEARAHVAAGLALAPDSMNIRADAARYELHCTGDAERANALMQELDLRDAEIYVYLQAWWSALFAGDYAQLQHLHDILVSGPAHFGPVFAALNLAQAEMYRGNQEAAWVELTRAGEILTRLGADPGTSGKAQFLFANALYHALQGNAEETLRWRERYRQRTWQDSKGDLYQDVENRQQYAVLLAHAGQPEAAIEEMRAVLESEGGGTFLYTDRWASILGLKELPSYRELAAEFGPASGSD